MGYGATKDNSLIHNSDRFIAGKKLIIKPGKLSG
jgi:hypothetical protein